MRVKKGLKSLVWWTRLVRHLVCCSSDGVPIYVSRTCPPLALGAMRARPSPPKVWERSRGRLSTVPSPLLQREQEGIIFCLSLFRDGMMHYIHGALF